MNLIKSISNHPWKCEDCGKEIFNHWKAEGKRLCSLCVKKRIIEEHKEFLKDAELMIVDKKNFD